MNEKDYYLAINDSWKFLKKYTQNIPETEEEWREVSEKARELGNAGPKDSMFRARLMVMMLEEIKLNARRKKDNH